MQVIARSFAQAATFLPHLVLVAFFGTCRKISFIPPINLDPFMDTIMNIRRNGITQTRFTIAATAHVEFTIPDVQLRIDMIVTLVERGLPESSASFISVLCTLGVLGAGFFMFVVFHVRTVPIVFPGVSERCSVHFNETIRICEVSALLFIKSTT
jgi:hypothetical protein